MALPLLRRIEEDDRDRSIGAVYELVRDVNRDVTKLADRLMKASRGVKRKPARKRKSAKASPKKKAGGPKATRAA